MVFRMVPSRSNIQHFIIFFTASIYPLQLREGCHEALLLAVVEFDGIEHVATHILGGNYRTASKHHMLDASSGLKASNAKALRCCALCALDNVGASIPLSRGVLTPEI